MPPPVVGLPLPTPTLGTVMGTPALGAGQPLVLTVYSPEFVSSHTGTGGASRTHAYDGTAACTWQYSPTSDSLPGGMGGRAGGAAMGLGEDVLAVWALSDLYPNPAMAAACGQVRLARFILGA